MREYSFRKDGFTFERVSKATARRVFNNDMPVMLCPLYAVIHSPGSSPGYWFIMQP